MATNEAKTGPDTDALFTRLAEPFGLSEIKWRVTHTSHDGTRGAVIAFADPRAYTDRLNQLFTPSGWTRNYDVTTVSAVSRQKRDKIIQTGKVLVTCTLTIARLGTHSGSGEQWADEQNAMTGAEAQAFKRASSCFGLGRYLYNLPETWVDLDGQRRPTRLPALPNWALAKANSATGKTNPACGPRPPEVQRGPIDQKTTAKIEGFRRILGDPIYQEILWRVARARQANAIPNAQLQATVAEAMERASRGIRKVQSLAESIGDTQFVSVLDRLHIGSMTTIGNLEALRHLVSELEGLAGQPAA
ncbi:MAG: Rad52/Rad22 family DNA repair protein [Terracidiphilus sp.]